MLLGTATLKSLRVCKDKTDVILDQIKNKTYSDFLKILDKISQTAKYPIWLAVRLAILNAINSTKKSLILEKDFLSYKIIEAYTTKGNTLKRIQPRAKGKAYRIEKKKNNITIKVSNF